MKNNRLFQMKITNKCQKKTSTSSSQLIFTSSIDYLNYIDKIKDSTNKQLTTLFHQK